MFGSRWTPRRLSSDGSQTGLLSNERVILHRTDVRERWQALKEAPLPTERRRCSIPLTRLQPEV